MLTAKGLRFSSKKSFFAAARKVKETAAAVQSERRPQLSLLTVELDDGQSVSLSAEERLRIGEQLFDGGGIDAVGLHELVLAAAVAAADGAKRAKLLNGVFVCGGGSLVDGLPERLGDELRKLAADPDAVQIRAGPRRADAAVVGAAALAAAPDVEVAWATADAKNISPAVAAAAAAASPARSVVEATPRARAALAHASASRDAAPESSPRSFTPPPPPRESPMLSPASLDIVRQGVSKIAAATVSPPRHALPPLPPPRTSPVVADGSEGAPFDLGVESPQAHDPLRTKKPELPPPRNVTSMRPRGAPSSSPPRRPPTRRSSPGCGARGSCGSRSRRSRSGGRPFCSI